MAPSPETTPPLPVVDFFDQPDTVDHIERQLARLRDQLAILAGVRPTPEQLAGEDTADKAMARRIHQARPGIPVHHILATLQAFRAVLEMEEVDSEKCCVCGSRTVVYHNYREQPFCAPCADPASATDARSNRLAAALSEALIAFGPVTSHTGIRIGWTVPHPVHPDDYDRWNAALKPSSQEGS
jgi:hypothetical protein